MQDWFKRSFGHKLINAKIKKAEVVVIHYFRDPLLSQAAERQ